MEVRLDLGVTVLLAELLEVDPGDVAGVAEAEPLVHAVDVRIAVCVDWF